MRNLSELTCSEIEAINEDEAVEAIEGAIVSEINAGSWWNLFDCEGFGRAVTIIGDIHIEFRAGLPSDQVSDALRERFDTDELDGMADGDLDRLKRLELEEAETIVADCLEEGLAKRVWTELLERHAARAGA